jgi:hypothetical protein
MVHTMTGHLIEHEKTLAGQLAVVADLLITKMQHEHDHLPGRADFREAFDPFIKRTITKERIDEAMGGSSITWVAQMRKRLEKLEQEVRGIIEDLQAINP